MAQEELSAERKLGLEVGGRIRDFRLAMGWKQQKQMAKEARAVLKDGTAASRISAWENGGWDSGALAKVSLLHRAPAECFKWLLEGGEMPRLHVDRNERGSDVRQPGVNHARALEAIAAVNRFAVELAEILRRDPRATGAEVLEVTQKIKDSEVDGGQAEDE